MPVSLLKVARCIDKFFAGESPAHHAMRRLAATLDKMQIPFAIAGDMAANAHGYRHTTAELHVVFSREGLSQFKARHIGHGWIDKFEGSRSFRDREHEVDVGVLMEGVLPGDEQSIPVRVPSPQVAVRLGADRIPYLPLPLLIELNIALSMTASHRLNELSDAIQLIRVNKLPEDYAEQLNPYVADKYRELWQAAQIEDDY